MPAISDAAPATPAVTGAPWVFAQLGGDKKTLTLQGWAAPFGRPRKAPVATTPLEVREYVRRYPGSDVPTRHLFGTFWDDIELHGRWMDSDGGRGFARTMTETVQSFIADQQPVQVTWGDTLSFKGLLKRIDPEWESPQHVAWKVRILVDTNDSLHKPRIVPKPKSPSTVTNRLTEIMSDAMQKALDEPAILKGSFVDFLASLVSLVNTPSTALLRLSQDIQSFETATIAQLKRFVGGLEQYRTALLGFRSGYESALREIALEFERADEELTLYRSQSAFGATMANVLKQIADAETAASKAERGKIRAIARAKMGDTWESLSLRGYSSTDRAADIREANDIPAGLQPVPGTDYILPT